MSPQQNKLQRALPYLLVFTMCIFIVAVSECTQITLKKFNYPFILRYINNLEQILLYFIIIVWRRCKQRSVKSTPTDAGNFDHSGINYRRNTNESLHVNKIYIIKPDHDFNDRHRFWFLLYTFIGAVCTSSAGMILNIGFKHITVPTATSLNTFRAVFVLILSVLFLRFPLKLWNICAVFVSSIGMLLFVMESQTNESHRDGTQHDSLYGCALVLGAQLLFAVNDIICKKAANYCYVPNRRLLGNVLYTINTSLLALPIFVWVLFVPQDIFADHEYTFAWNDTCWILLTGVMLIGVHITGYIAITLKSPMYVALGFLLATPMAFATDAVFHDYDPSYLCVLGALFLLVGFLMLELLPPSQIVCPFCDKILVNKSDIVDDLMFDENEVVDDFAKKCRLTDSFDDEYGYQNSKVLNKNSVFNFGDRSGHQGLKQRKDIDRNDAVDRPQNSNMYTSNSNEKYNHLNHSGNSSEDIHEPMLSAVLHSGGTYESAVRHFTPDNLTDISFDVDRTRSLDD